MNSFIIISTDSLDITFTWITVISIVVFGVLRILIKLIDIWHSNKLIKKYQKDPDGVKKALKAVGKFKA
ncbi:MAG: hypothetical protein ACI9Y7_002885 [Dokdonia sp.]|jgi:hypothetical protein